MNLKNLKVRNNFKIDNHMFYCKEAHFRNYVKSNEKLFYYLSINDSTNVFEISYIGQVKKTTEMRFNKENADSVLTLILKEIKQEPFYLKKIVDANIY